jgi:hypothetical protein
VTHTFLWNAKLDSNVPLSNLSIVLNQFINPFLVKLVGCFERSSTSLFITQFGPSLFASLPFSGPAMHSAHANRVIITNNLHSAVNFNWRDSFGSQKLNYGTLQASMSHTIATQQFNTAPCCQLRWKNRCYKTYHNLSCVTAAICWQAIKLEALLFIHPSYFS